MTVEDQKSLKKNLKAQKHLMTGVLFSRAYVDQVDTGSPKENDHGKT